jgi:hypothetical protein
LDLIGAGMTLQITQHSVSEFADVFRALLPLGKAWEWPLGGTGDQLLKGVAVELTRLELAAQAVLDDAIALHQPKTSSWRIADYQAVADESQLGVIESLPRLPFTSGSHAGDRLWASPVPTFAVPLVKVSQARPFCAGSRCGDALWGHRDRCVVLVRYFHGVVDTAKLTTALLAFKQAHAFLFFQDITRNGGVFTQG